MGHPFSKIDYYDDVDENDWYDELLGSTQPTGMEGVGYRQFGGNLDTSRAMLVTILYRLSESDDALENTFVDVESGNGIQMPSLGSRKWHYRRLWQRGIWSR